MTEMKTYEGGCHCGSVRYKVTTDLAKIIECNCSICSKTGSLLTFVAPDEFDLVREGTVTDYQFNKKTIHHLFCDKCGIRSYAYGTSPTGDKMIAINVRCLDDVDPSKLETMKFDGRSL